MRPRWTASRGTARRPAKSTGLQDKQRPIPRPTFSPPRRRFGTGQARSSPAGISVANSSMGRGRTTGNKSVRWFRPAYPDPTESRRYFRSSYPGKAPRNVAQVGRIYEQVITKVLACSVRKDRAVVFQSFGNSPAAAEHWVVQLSTGKVLWTHTFDPSSAKVVVASPDGEYISETSVAQANPGSAIYGADGTLLARLRARVEGFCWDGSLAVTNGG